MRNSLETSTVALALTSSREQILHVSSCVKLEQRDNLLIPEAYILEVGFETVPLNVAEASLGFTVLPRLTSNT